MWTKAIEAGVKGQPILDNLAFEFNTQTPGLLKWINERGAQLVTACTQEQKEAIAALLTKKMREQHTVDELSRFIRPCIGLTKGDAKAVAKLYDSIIENLKKEHPRMKPESMQKKALDAACKYAERKHRQRAMTIARTESAFAYNRGADAGVRQAQEQGYLGTVKKRWSTSGDDRVCSICQALEGMEIEMEKGFPFKGRMLFPGQDLLPPAHPNCGCAVEYIEVAPPLLTEKEMLVVESEYGIIELSDEEQLAINRYISSDAYVLNDKLRHQEDLSEAENSWVESLDRALDKMPEYQGIVYRSVSDFGIRDVDTFINSYVVGEQRVFSEYLSCSEEIYDESFPIQFIILSVHGKDIRSYNGAEKEILFKRDSVFLVTKVDGTLIYMEEA